MHHIFVSENEIDVANKTIRILAKDENDNYNHLVKSLRIQVGEMILCSVSPFMHSFDYKSEIKEVTDEYVELYIIENVDTNELSAEINLYQGISKFGKLDFIIEKSVELGVNSITPIATEHCVAKIEEKKSEKKLDRFNKISKSAAEQSKRHIIPKVNDSLEFKQMIEFLNNEKQNAIKEGAKCYNILFYENADGIGHTKNYIGRIKENLVKNDGKTIVNVIIGPEGGFSESEIKIASENGIEILSLGDRILRTETAAVVALSILMYELSG